MTPNIKPCKPRASVPEGGPVANTAEAKLKGGDSFKWKLGNILGSYWGYIGVILGLYWGYIGVIWE